jgi:hypothetical protein
MTLMELALKISSYNFEDFESIYHIPSDELTDFIFDAKNLAMQVQETLDPNFEEEEDQKILGHLHKALEKI